MIKHKVKIYNYIKREISQRTKNAYIFLVLASFLLIFDLIFAVICEGEAPLFVGAFGLTSLVLLAFSLFLNIKQCMEDNKLYSESFFCFLGIFINIVLWIYCLFL